MDKEKICGIYCIENIVNHKKYIGQSINIRSRFYDHKSELRRNSHRNEHLQKAWNKYGENNFNFSVIEKCDPCVLDEREQYYIQLYDTYTHKNGYNIELGGKGKGIVPDSIKQKISKHHADVSGKNNPFYGKHHSKQILNKIINSDGYLNRKVYGEDNHLSKLTKQDVISIKNYFKNHDTTYKDLALIADKYNVSTSTISHIKYNHSWKWLIV